MALIEGEAGSGKSSVLRKMMSGDVECNPLALGNGGGDGGGRDDDDDDDEVRLLVRADMLWRARRQLLTTETRARCLVDVHVRSLDAMALSNATTTTTTTTTTTPMTIDEPMRVALAAAVERGQCALLVDALDELPSTERASSEFGPWLDALCRWTRRNRGGGGGSGDNGNDDKALFRRVVLSSRPAVVDHLMRDVPRFVIAPLDDDTDGPKYVRQLVEQWTMAKEVVVKGKSVDTLVKDVWENRRQVVSEIVMFFVVVVVVVI